MHYSEKYPFVYPLFKFKHIYFTLIEKQVLTAYTNLSRFCFLGTTPVLTPNVWANEKIPKLTPAPGNRTWDLKISSVAVTGSPKKYIDTPIDIYCLYLSHVFVKRVNVQLSDA